MAQQPSGLLKSSIDNPNLLDKQAVSFDEPYLVWMGLLSQNGANPPTAIVKRNTLGGDIVWSRTAAGIYLGTLTGAFAGVDQCCIFTQSIDTVAIQRKIFTCLRLSADQIVVYTTDGAGTWADTIISNNYLEIKVFPR